MYYKTQVYINVFFSDYDLVIYKVEFMDINEGLGVKDYLGMVVVLCQKCVFTIIKITIVYHKKQPSTHECGK